MTILVAGVHSLLGATQYEIRVLDDLGGGFARAYGVNSTLEVVGESLLPGADLVVRGVSWRQGDAFDLGTLGGVGSSVSDINDSGTISGWAQDASGSLQPVLWDTGGIRPLPTLGGTGGGVWGLNEAGQAVGNSFLESGLYHATLWDGNGPRDLGTLGGEYSVAYDINNTGLVVGSADGLDGETWACLWDADGASDLGGLSGGRWDEAREINDSGALVLWGVPAGGADKHAAYWSGEAGSPVTDLGTFGGRESWATDLNNEGLVVGWADLADSSRHAFVWDGVAMIDLGTLGGLSSTAYAINEDGVIAGAARDSQNVMRAVIWVPVPEPSMKALLLAGLGVLACVRRRVST